MSRKRSSTPPAAAAAPEPVAAPSTAPAGLVGETFFERVLLWERADAALDAAKKAEAAARDALLTADFADRIIGTNTRALPDGRTVKCVAALRYDIGEAEARACVKTLAEMGDLGRELAGRLFKFSPEVRVGELKKLPEAMRTVADAAITTKPARPTIAIVEPSTPSA